MLIVSSTQSTYITLTLTEMAQNQLNPYYTFQINRKGSNDVVYFTNDDLSTSPYYNKYLITPSVNGNIGLTQGIIPLIPGEYSYICYETSEQYDINLSSVVGVVEKGIMTVQGEALNIPDFILNNNQTIPVYQPN